MIIILESGSEKGGGGNMNKRCLIIGDGNFTFSLAFCNKHSSEDWTVVATSFEKKDEVIKRYDGASHVIEMLSNIGRGATECKVHCDVMHEVDGTTLHQIPLLNKDYFQRIIFNFPHCGGKSDIRRNQTLLRQFFISSSKILDPVEGEVWITLCKGQGGTPLDNLNRGYCNTWKIVEQAAEGGLILARAFPFKASDWPDYSQTGYRGTGKGFMVEGALTHVFRAPCVDTSVWRPTSIPHHELQGCRYCGCDKISSIDISAKIQQLAELQAYDTFEYPLLKQQWHPLFKIRESLTILIKRRLTAMKYSVTDMAAIECPLLLYHKSGSRCLSNCIPNTLLSINTRSGVDDIGEDASDTSEVIVFESHMEQRLPQSASLANKEECLIQSGACIRQTPLSSFNDNYYKPLVTHQLMICFRVSSTATAIMNDLIERILTDVLYNRDSSRFDSGLTIIDSESSSCSRTTISYCGCIVATCCRFPASSFGKDTESSVFSCVFELDQLVMMKCGVPDVRMLWSKDRRLYEQFTSNSSSPLNPIYLYPPVHIHDVSFWVHIPTADAVNSSNPATTSVKDGADHNHHLLSMVQIKLTSLIRQCCGMMVVSLSTVDVYHAGDYSNGRTSFCFRLTYSSCDIPLTFADTKLIQDELRKSIASTPGWELR